MVYIYESFVEIKLYGLKQLPHLWYKYLSMILIKLGFIIFLYEEAVFINTSYQIIIICHVDLMDVG